MSIAEISKTLMYAFCYDYDYIKPKYNNNTKLCCTQTHTVL